MCVSSGKICKAAYSTQIVTAKPRPTQVQFEVTALLVSLGYKQKSLQCGRRQCVHMYSNLAPDEVVFTFFTFFLIRDGRRTDGGQRTNIAIYRGSALPKNP